MTHKSITGNRVIAFCIIKETTLARATNIANIVMSYHLAIIIQLTHNFI